MKGMVVMAVETAPRPKDNKRQAPSEQLAQKIDFANSNAISTTSRHRTTTHPIPHQ